MIFVTVGTWRFDRLIELIDCAISEGRINRPVVAQIANGQYLPKHCQYFRSAPSLASYYQQAELVVAHGGTGTTLEVLERRLRLISVANADVQDNHQDEFLGALERAGYVTYCRDLTKLPDVIQAAFRGAAPRLMSGNLWLGVSKAIDALPSCGIDEPRRLQRWWSRWIRKIYPAEGIVHVTQTERQSCASPQR